MSIESSKFMCVPVGTSWQSIIGIMPHLKNWMCLVKYVQGNKDTCMFSSFASALHSMKINVLQKLAQRINAAGNTHEGSSICLEEVKLLATTHVPWLQLKRMRKSFSWQHDIGPHDFFVGVMRDTTGSVQHALCLHCSWVFDSNEPYALPLNKHSLDMCTWEVKDGIVKESSEFVTFKRGIQYVWHGNKSIP